MHGLDPDRLFTALMALPGAAIYAAVKVAALVAAGKFTWGAYGMVALNIIAAGLAGVCAAYFLAVPLAGLEIIPPSLRDPQLVAFALGAFTWEAAPVAYAAVKGRIGKQIGGGA